MTEKLTESTANENNGDTMNTGNGVNNDGGTDGNHRTVSNDENVTLKNDILNFLSQINEIQFKSQQIDDPELTNDEKKEIAREILENNHGKFLLRFGKYLQNKHLNYFDENQMNNDAMAITENDNDDDDNEIKYMLKDLRKNLEHKHKNIKNRRYAAMQAMIKENNYFSEKEMMQREPHLYEELVGQYLTDSEKRIRDSYDPKNTTFSKIVLDNYDKELMNELRKKQENEEKQQQQICEDTSQYSYDTCSENSNGKNSCPSTPPTSRKQWGNFDDDSNQATTSNEKESEIEFKKSHNSNQDDQRQKFITAGEREMLRQEFVGIMYSKFLEGEDKDFDYSKIDDNDELDDLKQIGQDDEDKYFDDSDDDNDLDIISYRNNIDRMDEDIESEDDLDIYMKHLNKHPAVQEQNYD